MVDFDIGIVGAGCAGRSLAWQLLEHGIDGRRVVLIDPRTEFGRDRTWCLFDVARHPFESLVSHAWSRWRVRGPGGGWIERSASGLRYTMLPSERFYDATTRRLEAAGVELRLGVSAGRVDTRGSDALIHTDRGTITAKAVFDSRPPARETSREKRFGTVSLVQHFTGWVIRSEAPRFDPGVATLMDFAVPQREGISFLYELPFDEHSALLEATFFDARSRSLEERQRLHRAVLDRRTDGMRFIIEHTETGAIPMSSARSRSRSSERVYHIGVAGGMAKPSTGYAFAAIQRYSEEMARRVSNANLDVDLPDPPEPRRWKTRAQDAVFLSYLDRYPEDAPEAFVRLFERLPPLVLARFLGDLGSPREDLAVMRTMPLGAMTREVLRSRAAWMWR